MTTDGADVLLTSTENDGEECSEATVEIKIKTLDSQTYTLRVNPCVSVPALKEQVETVTGVLSEQQRLICRGRVLKDDQLLSAYHVEDGHTLHLVVRQPPLPGLSSDPTIASQDPATNTSQNRATQVAHRVVLGTFNVAEQGDAFMPDINRIVSAVLSTIGLGGPASEGVGVFREYITERDAEMPTTDGGVDIAHVSPEDATLRDTSRRSSRVSAASLNPHPAVIPDSLLTLSQYISHLEHDFDLNVRDYASPLETSGGVNTDRLEDNSSNLPHDGQNLMPTPASLAEVVLAARQILIGQAAECLSQLANTLGGQASVTDGEERVRIQSSAMRSGALVQNLGALMFELGRTIMTLRMGNIPLEAVVNAGPAVFISRSGPNPMMVQPLPFQPGANFSSALLANGGGDLSGGFTGPGPVSRNIDIRIHAGSLIPRLSANQPRQEASNQAVPSRLSGTSSGPNSNSIINETTNRILPVHSLVTGLPASGSHLSDAASGGTGVGLFYPLLARIQHLPSNASLNQRINNAPNSVESNTTGIGDESVLGNIVSPVFASENSSAPNRDGLTVTSSANGEEERGDTRQDTQTFQTQFSNRFDELLHTLFPGEHIDMAIDNAQISSVASGSSEVLSGGEDGAVIGLQSTPAPGNDAVFFSNILRQIMPTLSQIVSENVAESSNLSGSSQSQMDSSSQQHSLHDQNDSSSPPPPKRRKTE